MSYGDLPQLPDDSETCVDALHKGLKSKGIELVKVNETCDVVYCYCGIRLHPLSCPSAFSVDETSGKLVGDHSVQRLERNCLRHGVNGCSNCLNSLSRVTTFPHSSYLYVCNCVPRCIVLLINHIVEKLE